MSRASSPVSSPSRKATSSSCSLSSSGRLMVHPTYYSTAPRKTGQADGKLDRASFVFVAGVRRSLVLHVDVVGQRHTQIHPRPAEQRLDPLGRQAHDVGDFSIVHFLE